MREQLILGIELSCDETAASIIRHGARGEILSSVIYSQIDEHAPYGGVVPEIAARSHLALMSTVVERAMNEASLGFDQLTGVAATAGPGLIGGVMVGLTTGKAIALAYDLPFLPVNHLEAHALTVRLNEDIAFPYMLLLVSGGHCQILWVKGLGEYRILGQTRDDAVGEAFDKAAKFLGLPYPGGPEIERHAAQGDGRRLVLPKPLYGTPGCDFSFSGLKTALQVQAQELAPATPQDIADLCASLQVSIIDCLVDRVSRALELLREEGETVTDFVVAGGVAANQKLRSRLATSASDYHVRFHVAPMELCTDNAAMIAWTGCEYMRANLWPDRDLALATAPRARWPLAS